MAFLARGLARRSQCRGKLANSTPVEQHTDGHFLDIRIARPSVRDLDWDHGAKMPGGTAGRGPGGL